MIQAAVVTGGHSFDVPAFQRLCRELEGVDAVVQHMDDFASSPEAVRDAYDAVVFYIFLREGPSDEGLPWYSGKPRTALEHLGATAQGIVVLHHALVAYPESPLWDQIVGIEDRFRDFEYHLGQTLRLAVADPTHPITAGLEPWEMPDETYVMPNAEGDNQILLTTDHPHSNRTLAWTRSHGRSRVFCFQSGHDNASWADESFRTVLRRGILWSAGRL